MNSSMHSKNGNVDTSTVIVSGRSASKIGFGTNKGSASRGRNEQS